MLQEYFKTSSKAPTNIIEKKKKSVDPVQGKRFFFFGPILQLGYKTYKICRKKI